MAASAAEEDKVSVVEFGFDLLKSVSHERLHVFRFLDGAQLLDGVSLGVTTLEVGIESGSPNVTALADDSGRDGEGGTSAGALLAVVGIAQPTTVYRGGCVFCREVGIGFRAGLLAQLAAEAFIWVDGRVMLPVGVLDHGDGRDRTNVGTGGAGCASLGGTKGGE